MPTDPDALIDAYLQLVLEANEKTNLTAISSNDDARLLHIEDSLVALEEMCAAPDGVYGDLGTGGGFPGVPLAIKTGRETLLVESVKKKAHAVEEIVSQLGLSSQIGIYADRIENLAKEKAEHFAVLTARAVGQLPSLLELSSPLLKKGGQLICYKAHIEDEEVKQAKKLEDILGMRLVSRRSLILSDGETYREIIVFEKVKPASIELPRKLGFAQKRPLTI